MQTNSIYSIYKSTQIPIEENVSKSILIQNKYSVFTPQACKTDSSETKYSIDSSATLNNGKDSESPLLEESEKSANAIGNIDRLFELSKTFDTVVVDRLPSVLSSLKRFNAGNDHPAKSKFSLREPPRILPIRQVLSADDSWSESGNDEEFKIRSVSKKKISEQSCGTPPPLIRGINILNNIDSDPLQIKVLPSFLRSKCKRFSSDEVIPDKQSAHVKFYKLSEIPILGKNARYFDLSPNFNALINLNRDLSENSFKLLNPPNGYKIQSKDILSRNNCLAAAFNKHSNTNKLKTLFINRITLNNPDIINKYDINRNIISDMYYEAISKCISSIKELQSYYINNNIIDKSLLSNASECIDEINKITDNVVDCLNMTKKSKKNNIQMEGEFKCTQCIMSFNTGQGLGGHMSRVHPNSSEQYKNKMDIRRSRTKNREILYSAKKELLARNGLNYDEVRKVVGAKKMIAKMIYENRFEYKNILKSLKK